MVVTQDDILAALRTIPDPEMPISIVDLGIVESVHLTPTMPGNGDGDAPDSDHATDVRVEILPTFVGCPALPMIQEQVEAKLQAMDGVNAVDVSFVFDPPWSVDRITEQGRADLREHGVTVPDSGSRLNVPGHMRGGGVELRASAATCPFCESNDVALESSFGPTRCRMIYYCNACRNTFEHLKRV